MSAALLFNKLYLPPPRPNLVLRPRLIDRLNKGLAQGGKLTLISASAGFGKTTLVSEWTSTLAPFPSRSTPVGLPPGEGPGVRAAWLSLDEDDNDQIRFLAYLVAALQTIVANIGAGVLGALQLNIQQMGALTLPAAVFEQDGALQVCFGLPYRLPPPPAFPPPSWTYR